MRNICINLLVVLLFFAACHRSPSRSSGQETENICSKLDTCILQEGDLIFRKGCGIESQIVVAADKGASYSHVGLLIYQQEGWMVLHAVPGEETETNGKQVIKQDALSLFLGSDRCIQACIMRYDTTPEAIETVKKHGLRLYDKKLLFDHSYKKSDTTKMYCTEFVCYLYKFIGIDLSEGRCHNFPMVKEPIIYPIDLVRNKKLRTVWNS